MVYSFTHEAGFCMNVLVIIPTYNESESIMAVIDGLLSLKENVEILVVDDDSPDGTADVVKSRGLPRIHLLSRQEKTGLGGAYRAGFLWALERGKFSHIVTMDGDGSHRCADLSLMLSKADTPNSVLFGTRWMPGGAIVNWPKNRQLLSRMGTTYARIALKIPLRDLTGGFRVYPITLLRELNISAIASEGYCFQIEMARAAVAHQCALVESPITFVEREHGVSKMNRSIVVEALWRVTLWGLRRRLGRSADKLHYVK